MPAVTDHAINSEYHRLVIAVVVTELAAIYGSSMGVSAGNAASCF